MIYNLKQTYVFVHQVFILIYTDIFDLYRSFPLFRQHFLHMFIIIIYYSLHALFLQATQQSALFVSNEL